MKVANILAAGALSAVIATPIALAADSMTPEQKKEIQQVVHDYLVSNPEVLIEASQALQQKQQKDMQVQAQSAISGNADQLFHEKLSVAGNSKGDVTLVEFFDYQCIHCKKMNPVITALLKKDNNLRVVYREFPIFGKSSELASQAALAAAMQGKYVAMHDALLNVGKRLDEKTVMETAKSVGLDMNRLKKDMASKEVADALKANRELAEKMHLMGTPAFVVAATPAGEFKAGGDVTFIPGAASEEALQELIQKAGKK